MTPAEVLIALVRQSEEQTKRLDRIEHVLGRIEEKQAEIIETLSAERDEGEEWKHGASDD